LMLLYLLIHLWGFWRHILLPLWWKSTCRGNYSLVTTCMCVLVQKWISHVIFSMIDIMLLLGRCVQWKSHLHTVHRFLSIFVHSVMLLGIAAVCA
jgi:hypothetical protein